MYCVCRGGLLDDFGRPPSLPLAGSAPLGVVASADGSILDLTSDGDVKLVPLKEVKRGLVPGEVGQDETSGQKRVT